MVAKITGEALAKVANTMRTGLAMDAKVLGEIACPIIDASRL